MKPDDIIKKTSNQKPEGKTEKNITPPIQLTYLSGKEEVLTWELSNQEFIHLLASQTEYNTFTGIRLRIDDGKKSYTFTIDVDQFVPNDTEVGEPMK